MPAATVAVVSLMVTTDPAEIVGTAWPRRVSNFILAFVLRPESTTVIAPTETSLTQTDNVCPGDNDTLSNSTSNERLVPEALYSALPRPPTKLRNRAFRSVPLSLRLAADVRELAVAVVEAFRVAVVVVLVVVVVEVPRLESSRDEPVPLRSSLAEPLVPLDDPLLELLVVSLFELLLEVPLRSAPSS